MDAVRTRTLISVCILTAFVRHGVSQLSDASVVKKDTGKNDDSVDAEELLRRRKIVDSYLTKNGATKEKWIETYHLNFKASEVKKPDQPELNSASDKTELDRSLKPTLYKDTNEKWIETYHLNFKASELDKLDQPKHSASDKTELDRNLKSTLYVDTNEEWIKTYHLNSKASELKNLDQPKLNSASDKTELDRSLKSSLYGDTNEEWIKTYHLNSKASELENLDQPKLNSASDKTELDRSLKPTLYKDTKDKWIETYHLNSKASELENLDQSKLNSVSDKTELHVCLKPTLYMDTKEKSTETCHLNSKASELEKLDQLKLNSVSDKTELDKSWKPTLDMDTKEKWIETWHLNSKASELENLDQPKLNSVSDKTELDKSLKPTLDMDAKEKWIETYHLNSKASELDKLDQTKQNSASDKTELDKSLKTTLYVDTNEEWIETYHLNFKASKHDKLGQPKQNSASDKTELDRSLKSTFDVDTKGKWIETYHLNFEASKPESLDQLNLNSISEKIELDQNLKPTFSDIEGRVIESKSSKSKPRSYTYRESLAVECIREKLYFIRWVKKLLGKFDNPYNDYNSISFSFNSDSLKSLEELLSLESFDVVKADEVIFYLISNATIHDKRYYSWSDFVPSYGYLFTYGTIILTTMMFLYCLVNRPIYALGLVIVFSCIWHGVNMRQKLIAQKHATLSRISPAYCVNALTEESSVFAHVKQYIIDYTYAEDCKKYYDALMVDPTSEINMFNVIINFAVTAFFQFFQVLGPVLNNFIKEVLYNTNITQKIFLILIFIFMFYIILLFLKYKIKLPFFLGSFEPTVLPVGSQAEDLKLSETDKLTIKNSQNADTSALNSRKVKVASSHTIVCDLKDKMSVLISSELRHVPQDDMNCEAYEIEEVKPFNLLDQGKEICTPREDANKISKEPGTCNSEFEIKLDKKKLSIIKPLPKE